MMIDDNYDLKIMMIMIVMIMIIIMIIMILIVIKYYLPFSILSM